MHERRFHGDVARLRTPERLARMELGRVVDLALEQIQAATLLDVGTGSGVFAEQFAARGLQVCGIDANADMLPVAKEFVPAGEFLPGTAEQIPYKENTFDLVFMGLVLHETDNALGALKEACRVSRQRVCVLEWPYSVQEFGPGIEERLTEAQVQAWAQEAGFRQAEVLPLTNLVLYRFEK